MRYLLVNHIAAYAGRDAAHVRVPVAWAEDLSAHATALAGVGWRLLVATPHLARSADEAGETIELRPEQHGFEHIRLTGYHSARTYLANRGEIARQLADAVATASVVQLDDGGHPVPLGLMGDEAAIAARRKRVWCFGRQDPTRRLRSVNLARQVTKRMLGHGVHMNIAARLAEAVRSADLVIAHNPQTPERYRDQWDARCHLLDRVDVRDADLLTAEQAEVRRERLIGRTGPLLVLSESRQVAAAGTDHALRALQRCLRLRADIRLIIAGDGQDLDYFRTLSWQLGLAAHVRFATQPTEIEQAREQCHVALDTRLSESVRCLAARSAARGMPPIVYQNADVPESPAFVRVPRGDVDRLSAALLQDAAGDPGELAARLFRGLAWLKPRTTDATHRIRAALAASL